MENKEKFMENMNSLSDDEQVERVLRIAKENNWYICYDVVGKTNFHVITENNVWICRHELDTMFNKKIYWSLIKKDKQERIKGSFGEILAEFIENYQESKKTIYL